MKKPLIQHHEFDTVSTMSAGQLEKLACFLELHPGFYPELKGEDAVIVGFRVGGCFLGVGEMYEFISTQPRLAPHEAALLLTKQPTKVNGRLE